MTATIDWAAMTAAETGVLLEHAMARLRGQPTPPPNLSGQTPMTVAWQALNEDVRERLIEGMMGELRRVGLAQCFPRRQSPAIHSHARPPVLAVGKTGVLQMAKATTNDLVTELAKPANRGVAALLDERTGAAHVFAVPVPYFAQDDGRSHGVPEVERRRRELDVRRQLDRARKRLRGAPVADRERGRAEVESLERELRELSAPRDEGRERQRSTIGER